MATRPSVMRRSAPRRDVSPACARTLFSLSLDMFDALSQLGNHELAVHLGQVGKVPEAEGDQELARRLVEERPAGRLLAARDPHEPALHQALEHTLGVHAA